MCNCRLAGYRTYTQGTLWWSTYTNFALKRDNLFLLEITIYGAFSCANDWLLIKVISFTATLSHLCSTNTFKGCALLMIFNVVV